MAKTGSVMCDGCGEKASEETAMKKWTEVTVSPGTSSARQREDLDLCPKCAKRVVASVRP